MAQQNLKVSEDTRGFGLFLSTLRAEWTKFRTVRSWTILLVVAVGFTILFPFLTANGTHQNICVQGICKPGHNVVPIGPQGKAVADSYSLFGRTLTGNGSITARITALTGETSTFPLNASSPAASKHTHAALAPWAKAGILLTSRPKPGNPYAAVMVTGHHGVRWQYNYTHDSPGLSGSITSSASRWLRLTRKGDTITSYDSLNGMRWLKIGTAHLKKLPKSVSVGLFVTSPVSFQNKVGHATRAKAIFDKVRIDNHVVSTGWHGENIGASQLNFYPTLGQGSFRRSGDSFVVSGSGDIAPAVIQGMYGNTAGSTLPLGLIVGLMVIIVVAVGFMTVEYRRGIIRTTYTAIPKRFSVLTAKAFIVACTAFVTGAIAAMIAIPLSDHILTANGSYVFPASTFTLFRIIAGVGAVTSATAVSVLAVGAILRNTAGAISGGIAVFVMPALAAYFISGGVGQWVYALSPDAGFAVLQALPYSSQVSFPYTMSHGYYPLSPWAGLAVLWGYTALALALAAYRLPRRDA